MKIILQGIVFIIPLLLSILFFLYEKAIPLMVFQKPIALTNGVLFIPAGILYLVLYVMLMLKERQGKFICFSLAQWCCVFFCLLSIMIAAQSLTWFGFEAATNSHPEWLCVFCKLLTTGLWVGFILVAQYICVTSFGRTIFGGRSLVKPRKHIGEIAMPMAADFGIAPEVLEKLLEKAYKQQQDNLREENDV